MISNGGKSCHHPRGLENEIRVHRRMANVPPTRVYHMCYHGAFTYVGDVSGTSLRSSAKKDESGELKCTQMD